MYFNCTGVCVNYMRCPVIRAGEDWYLNEEMQAKPHTEYYTDIVGYHYNFPREGSLCDLRNRGLLDG